MNGWIDLRYGMYVKPIDWEELLLIEPQFEGMLFSVSRCRVDGTVAVIGTGATPAAAARLT